MTFLCFLRHSAILKLKRFGEKRISGIKKAKIRFWNGDIEEIGQEILNLTEKKSRLYLLIQNLQM
jgi:hypothetical protein